jgi:hypothetical protein
MANLSGIKLFVQVAKLGQFLRNLAQSPPFGCVDFPSGQRAGRPIVKVSLHNAIFKLLARLILLNSVRSSGVSGWHNAIPEK